MKRTVVIFGGTGFLGLSLADYLSERGFEIILVARHHVKTIHQQLLWNGYSIGEWRRCLEGAYAIVNLAGRSVDCQKTPGNCDLILRSRVESVKTISSAINGLKVVPKVWVQMSTAHIYGDPPFRFCNEDSPTGYGLAPEVGKAWEESFEKAIIPGVRPVILRTGFVIGGGGGALQSLSRLAKLGLGGKVGHGQQGMSWIHQTDFNEIVFRALTEPQYNGVYNLTAPQPVSNQDFMKVLRKGLRIPFGLPASGWMTRLGAKYIFNTDPELALYGRHVLPDRLQKQGYTFQFPEVEGAVKDLIMN